MNGRQRRSAMIGLCVCALMACAAARKRALLQLSDARLARASELHAEAVAAAPFKHFRHARDAAQRAPLDSAERADRSAEARLWLEVAISQAEQARLAEQRLVRERENVRLDEVFLEQERRRLALEDEADLREAAGIARLEAERALARAAQAPAQRARLSGPELERAARALLERAELVELALPPGVAAPEASARLAASLKEARAQLSRAPERALAAADQALFQALALLGPLRAQTGPDDAQKASLLEALELLGARVVRDERGLTATLAAGLSRGAASPSARRVLGRLCSLAQGYPQGPVQVLVEAGALQQRAALQRLLGEQGCAGERFNLAASEHAAAGALSFTWLAY